ncbi:MAG: MarR family transcriptional regulator [Methanofastidiosum sp.]
MKKLIIILLIIMGISCQIPIQAQEDFACMGCTIDVDVYEKSEHVTIRMIFLNLGLPDFNGFSLYVPGSVNNLKIVDEAGNVLESSSSPIGKESFVKFYFNSSVKLGDKILVIIEYDANDLITKNDSYVLSFPFESPCDIRYLKMTFNFEKGIPVLSEFLPSPSRFESVDNKVSVVWYKENVKEGEKFTFNANYDEKHTVLRQIKDQTPPIEEPQSNPAMYILMATAIIFFGLITILLITRKRGHSKIDVALNVLDPRESRILKIISDNGGSMTQAKLFEQTTFFSKPTLSRVLDKLLKRKLIEKEEKGRTNIIKLGEKLKD